MFSHVINDRFKSVVAYVHKGIPVGYYSTNGLITTNRKNALVIGPKDHALAGRSRNLAQLLLNGPHPLDQYTDLHVSIIDVVRKEFFPVEARVFHTGWGLAGTVISHDTDEDNTVMVKFDEPTDHGDELDVEVENLIKVK